MCFYSIPHCYSFTFIWLKTTNFKSSWPFNRGIKQKNHPWDGKKLPAGWPLTIFPGRWPLAAKYRLAA